jgi:hypothetical protein
VTPVAALALSAGLELEATALDGTTHRFRTLQAVYAVPTDLRAVLVQADTAAGPVDGTRAYRERGIAAFGGEPAADAALWLGFDGPLPARGPDDSPLRLALTFSSGRSGPEERARLLAEQIAQAEARRRPLPPAPPCAVPAEAAASPDAAPAQFALTNGGLTHHGVRLAWEIYAAGTWQSLDAALGHLRDDTRALTLDGTVELWPPVATSPFPDGPAAGLHCLRVRLLSGAYDTPPMLARVVPNAVEVEQAVPLIASWIVAADAAVQGSPPDGSGPARLAFSVNDAGQIDALNFTSSERADDAEVLTYRAPDGEQPGLLVADLTPLGTGSGRPHQRVTLPRPPIQDGSCAVYPLPPPATDPQPSVPLAWYVRSDFAASPADARHVTLDAVRGEIRFGDGLHGRVAPAGTPLLARARTTNVAAGRIDRLAPSLRNWLLLDALLPPSDRIGAQPVSALGAADPSRAWAALGADGFQSVSQQLAWSNPEPASGGADAERTEQAAARAIERLRTPSRAITAADIESLALQTPGTAIARVRALPRQHPSFPGRAAPGVVTVIVVPDQRGARPTPGPGLLGAVRQYLDARRIIGTRLEIVGPRYLEVRVIATVRSRAGTLPQRVQRDVLDALSAFMHPLTGGPAAIRPAQRGRPTLPAPPPATAFAAPGVLPLTPTAPTVPVIPAGPPSAPGWPFGRDVYRSEVLQVIDGVAGVDNVESVALVGDGSPAQCGNLCVGPTVLVVSGPHEIEVR